MSVYDSNLNLIGDVTLGDVIALGRTNLTAGQRAASMVRGGPLSSSAANILRSANLAPAALVVPTERTAASGPDDSGGGIPRPILIGAGVAAVLAIGLVAFKLHKG